MYAMTWGGVGESARVDVPVCRLSRLGVWDRSRMAAILSGRGRGVGSCLAAVVDAADHDHEVLVAQLGYGRDLVVPRYAPLLEVHGFRSVGGSRGERAAR